MIHFQQNIAFDPKFGRQMRFLAGPRQVGKTTLAKQILAENNSSALYYNWDRREIRNRYKTNPYFFAADAPSAQKKKLWVCFDEIHKMPKWKNILKDFFDGYEDRFKFIVTGSARLDWFRKSGDSLAGRYFLFRMFPFTFYEITAPQASSPVPPPASAKTFVEKQISNRHPHRDLLAQLLTFSGFPEPFTNANAQFHQHWQDDYLDRLVREDLRDLTRIHELENVATLVTLLKQRVGSPLSINSLREDLETSYTATRNYLEALKLCYIVFTLSPYTNKIQRAVKKEPKLYFFDYTHVLDPAARFENFLALELYALVHLWTDAGFGRFELRYVRSRDGKESDFLILKNQNPWLLAECKLSDGELDKHHLNHAHLLGKIPFIQITKQSDICRILSPTCFSVSAERFFGHQS
ncbi:MAG: hypothetical protein A3G32_09650 [Deltaproteobacteria bacterium RIFCSPLOWO2_12_FULL_40_28]|nr:MAG: hypothetical protein A3C45_04745 [Deltaproteobacteria bacterium RIFCSPHIGHO2_02_FULL_40_28]OGQ20222.1 MAG: hypothetical protein A3E27_06025 [Deltaproteobacteria bacterium RIFCSPHIGHO2_12_FULL_40_32]OGQ40341.1 MAG: hypothetical protein A3I69_08905 [Deltaproteobacteria bacterium RIFCSPLOWO2_02_FULL_40_36]OGQ54795.1 MAG: hypothetical protein A3G32_09650 [Deltaproteobacteria bacterium RIFCSPLOWO2_12_FULL_40_28]